MQTERRVAANPQTKSIDLAVSQLPSTSAITIVIITQPVNGYSFYRPTKDGRLSIPGHCSKGAQPVAKAVYRSSCRDKHKRPGRDSNLGPLTPRSNALTTRLLRPHLPLHLSTFYPSPQAEPAYNNAPSCVGFWKNEYRLH